MREEDLFKLELDGTRVPRSNCLGHLRAEGKRLCARAAGDVHEHAVCAVYEGEVTCWGLDADMPGDPISLTGDFGDEVCVGTEFGCAVTASGGVACWGDNAVGQLGRADPTSSPMPLGVTAAD